MKVSIVLPVFNQKLYIRASLQSICTQTYQNLEIIVADDASTDESLESIQDLIKSDSRIKVLTTETNLGISKNFNRAFDACTGDYVAFLGGDDLMYPEKIQKQVEFLDAHPEYVAVIHDADFINADGQSTGKYTYRGPQPIFPPNWGFGTDWHNNGWKFGILPSTTLARSDYYLSAMYPEVFKYKHEVVHNFEIWASNPKGKWKYLKETLGAYRQHSENYSAKPINMQCIHSETIKMVDLLLKKYPDHKDVLSEFYDYYLYTRLKGDMSSLRMHLQTIKYSSIKTYAHLILRMIFLNRKGLCKK